MTTTFVRENCERHPETFVGLSAMREEQVPLGWRRLVIALLGDLVTVLGPVPPHRIQVRSVGVEGGLRFEYALHPAPGSGAPVTEVIATIVRAAERRSCEVCDRCAGPGIPRQSPDGVCTVRCDADADAGVPVPGWPPPHRLSRGFAPSNDRDFEHDFTHRACTGLQGIADATGEEEVPPGWQRLCLDLLADVDAMMTGAQHRRVDIRRLHAEGQALRWQVVMPRSLPEIVRKGIDIAFFRASEEAAATCRACGRKHGEPVDDLALCPCGAPQPHQSSGPRAPAIFLPGWSSRAPSGDPAGRRPARLRRWKGVPRADSLLRIPIYRRLDVAASLGLASEGPEGPDLLILGEAGDTEQQSRLQAILDRGEEGRFRRLATPDAARIADVAALVKVAPHLGAVIDHVVRHLQAASSIGLPISLPPTLLLGPPGSGKTWLMSRIAEVLGLPFRLLPMNLTATNDGISGAHAVWRNAGPGIVAKTLLTEAIANFLVLADELDKARFHSGTDPYASFYTLMEPVGARTFMDEYYGVPFDASQILWIASANDLGPIPEPILSRLTILDAPPPGPEHLSSIVDSIYADANACRRSFFAPRLDPGLHARLAGQSPRAIRLLIEDAMVRAAADGRRDVSAADLIERKGIARKQIGFIRSGDV